MDLRRQKNRLKIENIEKLMVIYFNCIDKDPNLEIVMDVDED